MRRDVVLLVAVLGANDMVVGLTRNVVDDCTEDEGNRRCVRRQRSRGEAMERNSARVGAISRPVAVACSLQTQTGLDATELLAGAIASGSLVRRVEPLELSAEGLGKLGTSGRQTLHFLLEQASHESRDVHGVARTEDLDGFARSQVY